MKINNKEFGQWTKEDLEALIGEDSFRENEFIDYKITFSALECSDKNEKRKKQDEFRNDICSFANADGGYLFYGIKEEGGIPTKLIGIEIDNTDQFELQRRNEIASIKPAIPNINFSFVQIDDGRYVVILQVQRGIFRPYITVEGENTFRFFIRHGNKKQAMSYMEIANQFLSSLSLSEAINSFRVKRVDRWSEENEEKPYFLIHLIPATFQNSADQIPLMDLARHNKIRYQSIFEGLCGEYTSPNVDGVHFPYYEEYQEYQHLQLYNNGIIELEYDAYFKDIDESRVLLYLPVLEAIEKLIASTRKFYGVLNRHSTMYICVSAIDCKGMISSSIDFQTGYIGKVDRDQIFCSPLEIRDILDEEEVDRIHSLCKKETLYALGVKKIPQ